MIYHEMIGIRDFIESKMKEYDSNTYTDDDFAIYFNSEHKNIVALNDDGDIIAFCCLSRYNDGYRMCYTWCNKQGRKAYAQGIDHVINNYGPIYFGEGALKFNKIKRITNG